MKTKELAEKIKNIFPEKVILPVVTIEKAQDANRLADGFLKKNICTIEVTLRTPAALEAIKILSKRKDIVVGAGTINDVYKFKEAAEHGAAFFVSPGATESLLSYAAKNSLAYIPGVATASEIIFAEEFGFTYLKFFPAESAGGIKMLKSFKPVFQNVHFCPTGGVNEKNYQEYLSLENVFAVGGSWLSI